jgi:hypothetical protein
VIVSFRASAAVNYDYTSFLCDTFPIKIGFKWKYDEMVTIFRGSSPVPLLYGTSLVEELPHRNSQAGVSDPS